MVERILKTSAVFSVFLTIAVMVALMYLPRLQEVETAWQQDRMEEEEIKEKLKNMTGLQILDYNNSQTEDTPAEESFLEQLRIILPEGADESNVEITNSYVTQTIDIHVPGADEDYLYNYPMVGSSDHIDRLTYANNEESGIIEITTDKVYELNTRWEDGFLYVDFIDPHEIYDKVVVIDAGHGGNMPGAAIKGTYEKDIDLAIVMQLKSIFEENNDGSVGVYYTRLDDSNPGFDERVGLANKSEADLFISIHNNSTTTGKMSSINGTEVMYDELNPGENLGSRHLAEICAEEVTGMLGSRNRGITEGNEIYIIRSSEVPVALIEVGFMTNQDELNDLKSEEYQRKAAQGIYNAICRAFSEGY